MEAHTHKWITLLVCALMGCVPVCSQTVLRPARPGGTVRILNSDLAVFETPEDRTDLECEVTPVKPELGYDMRLHAGYQIEIPLRALAGNGDRLRVLIRITPEDKPNNRYYLMDWFRVPPIEEGAKGDATLPGDFTLGVGRYKVDWLMRNNVEQVCSSHWEMKAEDDSYRDLPLVLPADTIAERPKDVFRDLRPIQRVSAGRPLHVKLLVSFSPTNPGDSALRPQDKEAIVSILRNIARQPQIGRFSLVAFNMQEQKVIYRSDDAPSIDFPALGKAVHNMRLGEVDLDQLADRHGATRFLTGLLADQLGARHPAPDAIIIVGPKLMLDRKVPQEALKEAGPATCPVFYWNYNPNPMRNPWRDAIAAVLKVYQGLEYSISRPCDVSAALPDMMARLREPQ